MRLVEMAEAYVSENTEEMSLSEYIAVHNGTYCK